MRQKFDVNVAFTLYTNFEQNIKFSMTLNSHLFFSMHFVTMFNAQSLPTTKVIKFWEFSFFFQIFFLPQVKGSLIITNKLYIRVAYELPNDVRLRILGN